jgi:hypothetical protein
VFRHLSSFRRTRALEPNHRRIGRYRDHELRLTATRKLIATVLEPQLALTAAQSRERYYGGLSDERGTPARPSRTIGNSNTITIPRRMVEVNE